MKKFNGRAGTFGGLDSVEGGHKALREEAGWPLKEDRREDQAPLLKIGSFPGLLQGKVLLCPGDREGRIPDPGMQSFADGRCGNSRIFERACPPGYIGSCFTHLRDLRTMGFVLLIASEVATLGYVDGDVSLK